MSEGIAISLFLLGYLLYAKALGYWADGYKILNNDSEEEKEEEKK